MSEHIKSDANLTCSSLKITNFSTLQGLFLYPEYLEDSSGCTYGCFLNIFLVKTLWSPLILNFKAALAQRYFSTGSSQFPVLSGTLITEI